MINMVDLAHQVCGIKPKEITYPVQCRCGHLFLERYKINDAKEGNPIGFCWCGFCRSRLNIFQDNSFEYVEKSHHPQQLKEGYERSR